MKKIILQVLLLLFIVSFTQDVYAQREREEDDEHWEDDDEIRRKAEGKSLKDRLVLGGNFGLGFSNGWNIDISPRIGYRLFKNRQGLVGLSATYSYVTDNRADLSQSVYGGGAFASYEVIKDLGAYAHIEYEYLSYQIKDDNTDDVLNRIADDSFLMGGGYATSFGKGLGFRIELLYDILHTSRSPYPSPLRIRGGIMYGF